MIAYKWSAWKGGFTAYRNGWRINGVFFLMFYITALHGDPGLLPCFSVSFYQMHNGMGAS
jgi:hypothetical protein